MKIKKILINYLKGLYERSKLFRHISNYFGISFCSTIILTSSSLCPSCGQGIVSSPLGLIGLLITGFVLGLFVYLGLGIKNVYRYIKKYFKSTS